jgi:hypothetical protein
MVPPMSGKALIAIAVICTAGCATVQHETTAPAPPHPSTGAPPPETIRPPEAGLSGRPQATPRPTPRPPNRAAGPAAAPTPAPQSAAAKIKANVTRPPGANAIVASRGTAGDAVPLFRQAIVLANARSAVAGLPAAPRTDFQQGMLTLTFDRGTPDQIAAAVNRVLDLPEITRLRANLPP